MGTYYSCITNLDISNRGLLKLPDDIYKYTNLKVLDCRDNKLTSLDNLPNSQLAGYEDKPLGLPPKLEFLNCGDNPLKYDFEPTLENIRNYNASRILDS